MLPNHLFLININGVFAHGGNNCVSCQRRGKENKWTILHLGRTQFFCCVSVACMQVWGKASRNTWGVVVEEIMIAVIEIIEKTKRPQFSLCCLDLFVTALCVQRFEMWDLCGLCWRIQFQFHTHKLTHTQTERRARTHTLTYTYTNTNTRKLTRAHTHSQTETQANWNTLTHARTHTRARALTHTHTHAPTHTHTHMHARTHTHTHTHTHMHVCTPAFPPSTSPLRNSIGEWRFKVGSVFWAWYELRGQVQAVLY
jgi:adenine-specific DNA glycosylase